MLSAARGARVLSCVGNKKLFCQPGAINPNGLTRNKTFVGQKGE